MENSESYEAKYKEPDEVKDTGASFNHTKAEQAAYDFTVYLHKKMMKLPKFEKFTLQKEIREGIDIICDEIETYEVTKSVNHLYLADRAKRRLLRKIRLAYDLHYSAINGKALFYCASQLAIIGRLIGGLIETEKKNHKKGRG